MKVAYLILPDTVIAVSRDGGDFVEAINRRVLRFDAPDETTAATMTFTRGRTRYRVKRSWIVVSRWGNGEAENEWGA